MAFKFFQTITALSNAIVAIINIRITSSGDTRITSNGDTRGTS